MSEQKEEKEEKYEIAVKYTQIPNKLHKIKAESKLRIIFNKYGTREKWYTSAKTRKVSDVSNSLYSAISSGCRYGVNEITAYWFKNQFNDYAEALRELYSLSLYGYDEQGVLITHNNTYRVDKVRCIRTIDPYLQNPNNLNNAYVINKLEVKKLYNKYYKLWDKEMKIKNNIDTLQVKVNKIINTYKDLDSAISLNLKRLDNISVYSKYTFSPQEIRTYFLVTNERFFKNLGFGYEGHNKIWDDLYKTHRKVSGFMSYLDSNAYSMNQTYDMSWADLNMVQEYIKNTWDDENNTPKMKNHHNYNVEKRRYEFVTIEDLPTMVEFAQKATTLQELKNRYKLKLDEMKINWLSSLADYDADFLECFGQQTTTLA